MNKESYWARYWQLSLSVSEEDDFVVYFMKAGLLVGAVLGGLIGFGIAGIGGAIAFIPIGSIVGWFIFALIGHIVLRLPLFLFVGIVVGGVVAFIAVIIVLWGVGI